MEITKEKLPKSQIKLNIKVSSSEMRGFFAKVYSKLSSQVTVKGFRPGAAPKHMIISAIGENRLQSEIVDLALQETYSEALKKEKLLPIASPKVTVKMAKDLTGDTAELEYEVVIDLLPEVKLGDYKKIKIKKSKNKIEVSDEEVKQVLSHLARSKAEFKDIEGKVKSGDRIEINFEGSEKGVVLENLTSKNYPVILETNVLVPEFEKELIGLKKGDKKEFTVKMKKPGEEKEAPIDFKIEVTNTQDVILPEIDDKFSTTYGQKTLDELKKAVKVDIVKQKEQQSKHDEENQVLEELLKIIKVEIPDGLIANEINRQVDELTQRVTQMGMTFEKYLESVKKTEEELRKDLAPQAEKTIKIGLALGEIVKEEKLDSKDKEAGKKALEKLISYATK